MNRIAKTWSDWEIIRRQVTIGGYVENTVHKPVAGARLVITVFPKRFAAQIAGARAGTGAGGSAMDQRPDRIASRPDGGYFFMDLPNGDYTVRASISGSEEQVEQHASVSRDPAGRIEIAWANFRLAE